MLKKTHYSLLFIVLVGTIVFAQDKVEGSWYKLNSAEGKFTVLMPLEPALEISDIGGGEESIELYLYSIYYKSTVFMTAFNDLPFETLKTDEIELLLDEGRDSALQDLAGKLISEKKISLHTYPGREIIGKGKVADGSPVDIRFRLFLVKNRLYQLILLAPENVNSPDVDKFFLSFDLVK